MANLTIKAFQGKINSWGDGFMAFGIGAAAGAVTAATGGAAAGALGLSTASVAGGAVAGTVGAIYGSPIQGLGNEMYFGDPYTGKQYITDIIAGGVVGGIAGGVAGWIKNARTPAGAQKFDIFSGRPTKGKLGFEIGELKLSAQQEGFDLNYSNPSKYRPPIDGLEYLDDNLRMVNQPFGARYAFGFQYNAEKLATAINGKHFMKMNVEEAKAAYLKVINNPNSEIHFSLDDLDEPLYKMISTPNRSVTNWEIHMLYHNNAAFERTIFHYGGKTYIGNQIFGVKIPNW